MIDVLKNSINFVSNSGRGQILDMFIIGQKINSSAFRLVRGAVFLCLNFYDAEERTLDFKAKGTQGKGR